MKLIRLVGLLIGVLFSTQVLAVLDAQDYFTAPNQSQTYPWNIVNSGRSNNQSRQAKRQSSIHNKTKSLKPNQQDGDRDNSLYRKQIRHRHIDKNQFDGCGRSNNLSKYGGVC